jgi:NADH-quinone oxidoreductase subunit M
VASWANRPVRPRQYFAAVLLAEAGMLGVYLSLDLLVIALSWTIAAASLGAAIAAADGRPRPAGRVALIAVVPGAMLVAGVVMLHVQGRTLTGASTFDVRMFQNLSLPIADQRWVFASLAAGFVIGLAGVFRWWLAVDGRDRSAAMPLLVSAVFVKMTTFGFLRLCLPLLPDASRFFAKGIVVASAIAIVFGAVAAFAQATWTRVLAYASLSHVALVTLGAFTLTPDGVTGSAVQQINHGLSIAALFLIGAVIADRGHSTAIADYGGLLNRMPIVAGAWLFLTLSLIAVPRLNGFTGTELIVEGLWPVSRTWAVVAMAGLGLTAAALLWLFARMMLGELRGPGADLLKDLRLQEAAVVLPIVGLVVWAGLNPAPLLARVETSVARIILRVSPQYAPDVSDCLSQPAPTPDPMLPAGMLLAAPCADGGKTGGAADRKP